MASAPDTASSGLADELFSALPLALPDVELPSERELLSTADVAAALLVGGRARAGLVSRGGSDLSGVATLLTGEDGDVAGPDVSPLAGLFVSPLSLLPGLLPDGQALRRAEAPGEGAPAVEGERRRWPGLAGAVVAGLALTAALGGRQETSPVRLRRDSEGSRQ
jgi:hypothetical protein